MKLFKKGWVRILFKLDNKKEEFSINIHLINPSLLIEVVNLFFILCNFKLTLSNKLIKNKPPN